MKTPSILWVPSMVLLSFATPAGSYGESISCDDFAAAIKSAWLLPRIMSWQTYVSPEMLVGAMADQGLVPITALDVLDNRDEPYRSWWLWRADAARKYLTQRGLPEPAIRAFIGETLVYDGWQLSKIQGRTGSGTYLLFEGAWIDSVCRGNALFFTDGPKTPLRRIAFPSWTALGGPEACEARDSHLVPLLIDNRPYLLAVFRFYPRYGTARYVLLALHAAGFASAVCRIEVSIPAMAVIAETGGRVWDLPWPVEPIER